MKLEDRVNQLELAVKLLTERLEIIEDGKKRGPKTERPMTEQDAYRVKFGDMKQPLEHKKAAEALGLSYGQVFSARGGYTFKHVKDDGSWNADGTKKEKTNGGAK